MLLLEAATVIKTHRSNYLGDNHRTRECGVNIRLTDPCEDSSANIIGDGDSRAVTYQTQPFFVEALLQRTVACVLPDDVTWVEQALREFDDVVVGRSLIIQPIAGTDSWTNGTGVKSVTLAGSSDVQLADGAAAGRKKWMLEVIGAGARPLMHVPPSLAPALGRSGVLLPGQDKNIWGDTVVMSGGYDTATPRVFYTGPITVYLSDVDSLGEVNQARTNDLLYAANQVIEIDVPPCTIVRVGSYA